MPREYKFKEMILCSVKTILWQRILVIIKIRLVKLISLVGHTLPFLKTKHLKNRLGFRRFHAFMEFEACLGMTALHMAVLFPLSLAKELMLLRSLFSNPCFKRPIFS